MNSPASKPLVLLTCLILAIYGLNAFGGEKLYLQTPAAYGKDANVDPKVREECAPDAKVAAILKERLYGKFDEIVATKNPAGAGPGKTLNLTITNVMGVGGGAWSGPKSISVQGTLKDQGKVVGSFNARRTSGGGPFGGYKGTCAILERCAESLATDIAGWMEKPVMNAALGEMK